MSLPISPLGKFPQIIQGVKVTSRVEFFFLLFSLIPHPGS